MIGNNTLTNGIQLNFLSWRRTDSIGEAVIVSGLRNNLTIVLKNQSGKGRRNRIDDDLNLVNLSTRSFNQIEVPASVILPFVFPVRKSLSFVVSKSFVKNKLIFK